MPRKKDGRMFFIRPSFFGDSLRATYLNNYVLKIPLSDSTPSVILRLDVYLTFQRILIKHRMNSKSLIPTTPVFFTGDLRLPPIRC